MSDLERLYETRFSDKEVIKKRKLWNTICKYIKKKLNREYNVIVDVAAGYADFINNYPCVSKKYAIDINPAIKQYINKDVQAYVTSIEELSTFFDKNSVSLFFMSNFLEHITKEQIKKLLEDTYSLLEEGGDICILTPNIRYVGGKYWDFYDHITPITEKALIEQAEAMGYKTKLCIKKFLPYTTKSALPQATWIVKLYLKLMPVSGLFFGQQSLLVFTKSSI